MTLPITSGTTSHIVFDPLKRKTRAELYEVQKKMDAIQNRDALIEGINDWKERFLNALKRNDDVHPIVLQYVSEMVSMLNAVPQLAPSIQRIDERVELLETLISFLALHEKNLPEALTAVAKRIRRVRVTKPLTQEDIREIEEIRARKAREAEELAQLARPREPKVHTFRDIELKAEEDVRLRMERIDQLEQEMQNVSVQELIDAIQAIKQGNQDITRRVDQAHRSIRVLDRLLNPFCPVKEGEAAINQTPEAILNSAPRRRLRLELLLLELVIRDWNVNDEMTETIRIWAGKFWESLLRPLPHETICAQYIQLLQQYLIEPIYNTPLDEEAFYGSDGRVYGKKAHDLWKETITQFRFRSRSPFDTGNPTKLVLKPHPVVRYLTSWLKSYNALPTSNWLETELKELPLRLKNQIQGNLKVMNERAHSFEESKQREVQKQVEAQREVIHKNSDEILGLMNGEIITVDQKIQQYEFQVGKIMEDRTEEIKQLYKDIDKFNQHSTDLAVEISKNKNTMTELEAEGKQLENDIQETKKAIKKMKKNRKMGVVKTIAITAVCIGASYGAGLLAVELGLQGMAVVPLSAGSGAGAAVCASIPLNKGK